MENDKVKADFPRLLKEWRKANGLTQKELGKKLGLTQSMISHFEDGTRTLSIEIAITLSKLMNCDAQSLPKGRHKKIDDSSPLSEEERRFATENHDQVYYYMKAHQLSADEWYDVVIFGFLHAVRLWFVRDDLHKYCFTTISKWCMRNAVHCERKRQSHIHTVSIYDVIPDTKGMTYGNILCDPSDCVRT